MTKTEPIKDEGAGRCVVCKEQIRLGAQKCIHCDTFQGWRRYLSVGDSFLALLVALVSVLSLSLPLFRDTFRVNNSAVRVVFQDIQGPYLFVIASNAGTKPGTIGTAKIAVSGLDARFGTFIIEGMITEKSWIQRCWGILPLTAKGWDEEKTFIPAGESRPLKLYFAESASIIKGDPECISERRAKGGSELNMDAFSKAVVRLDIEVIQFDGTRDTQTYAPRDSSVESFMLREYLLNNLVYPQLQRNRQKPANTADQAGS